MRNFSMLHIRKVNSSMDNTAAALIKFTNMVHLADTAGKKEIRMEIKEAKAIAHAVAQAAIKLADLDDDNLDLDGGSGW